MTWLWILIIEPGNMRHFVLRPSFSTSTNDITIQSNHIIVSSSVHYIESVMAKLLLDIFFKLAEEWLVKFSRIITQPCLPSLASLSPLFWGTTRGQSAWLEPGVCRPRHPPGTSTPPPSSSELEQPPWAWPGLGPVLAQSLALWSSDMPGGFGNCHNHFIIFHYFYCRNPGLKQQLFSYAILGFALSEAMGLFCLMMAFLLLFAF